MLSIVQVLVCVLSSFVGKIYTHQRSEHIPGVSFCKYLLVNLLTRYVSVISPLFSVLCPFHQLDLNFYLGLFTRVVWSELKEVHKVQMSEQCVCVCKLRKLLVCYYVTFVFSVTVLWVLKYTICVIEYCDVVNAQPRFNFSNEIK